MMIIIHNVHLTRICTDYNFVDLQRKMAYCEKGKRGYKTSDNKGKKLFVQDRDKATKTAVKSAEKNFSNICK